MQLVYFQSRRCGILVPIFIVASCGIVALVRRLTPDLKNLNSYSLAAGAFCCAALLVAGLRWTLRKRSTQKIWNSLSEEWEHTNNIDEFMYLKLWQWSCFLI